MEAAAEAHRRSTGRRGRGTGMASSPTSSGAETPPPAGGRGSGAAAVARLSPPPRAVPDDDGATFPDAVPSPHSSVSSHTASSPDVLARGVLRTSQDLQTKARSSTSLGSQVMYGTRSYDLMYDMLFGIRLTTGRTSAMPLTDVVEEDFRDFTKLAVPRAGSDITPAHSSYDFKFKDYCPKVFRQLRERFGIDAADYMVSLTGDYVLTELSTPGKSGSVFFFSADERFIIKTVSKAEARHLLEILPTYCDHMMKNPHSLITRFFGLHRVKPFKGKKTHFVVMGNIFVPDREIAERYDLKGSTLGRTALEHGQDRSEVDVTTTFKDLDFRRKLLVSADKAKVFREQIVNDAEFLASMKIMDYSLLIGVHKEEPQGRRRQRPRSLSIRSAVDRKKDRTRAASMRLEPLNLDLDNLDLDHIPQEKTVSVFQRDEGGWGSLYSIEEGSREIYYLGIIDILTPYNGKKKLEHAYKSIKYDKNSISAVSPEQYAKRFVKFMLDIVEDSSVEGYSERPNQSGRSVPASM